MHAIYKHKIPMLSITLPHSLSIHYPKQTKKKTPIQVHAKKAITTHHHHKPPSSSLTTQASSPPTTTFMATTTLIINPKTTTITITILCTAVTLLIVLCYKTINRWWLRRRSPSLPPGPAGVPIFGNLLTLHPELHTHFATLAKTHGPIFTIKLGNRLAIVITGVDTAREVLRQQDDNFANRIIPAAAKTMEYITSNIVSSPNGPTLRLLPKLTYLGAVIKEVLRLHPALPLLVPHCPSSSCTINGYTIPQGSQVFVNVWAIHRDPAIWENPLEFKPERFLGIDGSKWDFTGNDFRYFPFGSGRRICAGIPMAERIVGYALASLLHSFDWNLPEGTELDLSERFGIVLKKAKPLVAVPTPRLSHVVLDS